MEENAVRAENMQKYENYREQNLRLKKAMDNCFYLEALFIEYAIMEDRLTSILRYEGNSINSKKHVSIDRKLSKVETIAREKKGLAGRYFTVDLLNSIRAWKGKRNDLIHAMMKMHLSTEGLFDLATEGRQLQKDLCRLAQNYKRAVERKQKAEQAKAQ